MGGGSAERTRAAGGLSLAEAAERSGWPRDILEDPSKHAQVVHDPAEFLSHVCYADHSQAQMCVLADGVRKLQLLDTVPRALLEACERHRTACGCVMEAIEREAGGAGDGLDGDVFWWPAGAVQRKEVRKGSLADRLKRCQQEAGKGDIVYVAEISRAERTPHPLTGERSRQLSTHDVRDLAGGRLPLWDRGHFFVGGEGAGSCMHIDQAWWSNVGKNFLGYKLVALWGPEAGPGALQSCKRELFRKPLTEGQVAALRAASKVALMRPGDVASFSGGLPHATVVVGDALNLTAYESCINWHPGNADLLLRGAARRDGEMVMLPRQMRLLLEDVADGAAACAADPPAKAGPPPDGSTPAELLGRFRSVLLRRRRCALRLRQPVCSAGGERYPSPSSQGSSRSDSPSRSPSPPPSRVVKGSSKGGAGSAEPPRRSCRGDSGSRKRRRCDSD